MKKERALAQHLDMDVFEYDEVYYIGMSQDEFENKEQEFLDIYETREEVDQAIKEMIDDFSLLEDEITVSSYDDCVFEAEGNEYLICDNGEADTKWEESIDNYIDECVIPEIPERYQSYFDYEKFRKDCEIDGRGHSLANYDGDENAEEVDFETFYIYRTN